MNSLISTHLSDYKPRSVIGYGKFSTVIKAKINHKHVAIKIITKVHKNNKINNILPISSSCTNYDTEINIIKKIQKYNHPNVLTYYTIFNTNQTIYIMQEISNFGELNPSNFKYFPNSDPNNINNLIINKLIDMLSAINFLHTLNIIHRDIKPSNFLLFENGLVKLTDFDTCYTLTDNPSEDKSQLYSKLIGTPLFLPPELLTHSTSKISDGKTTQTPIPPISPQSNTTTDTTKKSKFKVRQNFVKNGPFSKLFGKSNHISPKESSNSQPSSPSSLSASSTIIDIRTKLTYNPFMLDLWSLGVTLHYLFYSCYPFYADNEFTLLHKIATANAETPSIDNLSFKIEPDFPLIKIINMLLVKLPYNRWSIDDILEELRNSPSSNYHKSLRRYLGKDSMPFLIQRTDSNDLSISNLPESQSYEDSTPDINQSFDFTNNNSTLVSNDPNKTNDNTQQYKFQLPIFMSPKDIRYSHWNDSDKLAKLELSCPNQIIHNNVNNSSSSLPLEQHKSQNSHLPLHSTTKHNQIPTKTNGYSQLHSESHTVNPKSVNASNSTGVPNSSMISEDWNAGNDYAIVIKKLENLGPDEDRSKTNSTNNILNDKSVFTKPDFMSALDAAGNGNGEPGDNDKRSSIHTLPANFNLKSIRGSGKGLKHSEMMNFKKFKKLDNNDTNDKNKQLNNKPSYNALDKQLANDYKLYTSMDDYFDSLQ